MLQTIDLTKTYADFVAVNRLNLRIAPGDIYCLLGANGAGKTTTLNMFLGFIRPTSGEVRIGGLSVAEHPLQTKHHFSYIPESVSLYSSLSGLDNLEYFVALGGRKIPRSRLSDILVETGLAPQAIHRKVGTYSKGMRQRVGIALAVAKRSRALLLDEPTSGLDPRACHEFADLLRRMSAEGVAILMTTHDLFNAKECGTHVGILHRGQLVDSAELAGLSAVDLEKRFLKATDTAPAETNWAEDGGRRRATG